MPMCKPAAKRLPSMQRLRPTAAAGAAESSAQRIRSSTEQSSQQAGPPSLGRESWPPGSAAGGEVQTPPASGLLLGSAAFRLSASAVLDGRPSGIGQLEKQKQVGALHAAAAALMEHGPACPGLDCNLASLGASQMQA